MIVHPTPTQSALHDAHKARQAKWAATARRVRKSEPVASRQAATLPPLLPNPLACRKFIPLWTFGNLHFDQHVKAFEEWKAYQREIGFNRLKRYIGDRATELGSTYAEVVGRDRTKAVVRVRHLIIWEIKTQVKPKVSYPELGRLFNLDHTTCIFAVRKIAAQREKNA